MTRYTVSEYLAEALKNLGVKNIYGLIGTSILDFIDTLYDYRDDLRFITTRHEHTAVNMADAEYRVSNRLAAAVVHAGPGLLNSLIGLGIAYKDHVPLILISGGVRRRLYGSDAWLEVDQQTIVKPITKGSRRLEDENQLPSIFNELVTKAFEKPYGPIMIEIPEDLWGKSLDVNEFPSLNKIKPKPKPPSHDEVEEVVRRFESSSKPAILVCGEASEDGVENILAEVVERVGGYIITTGNARGACDEEHPRCLGRVGFGGGSLPADKVLENSDFILVLGDELDDITTYNYTVYPEGDLIVVSESNLIEKRLIYYDMVIKADPVQFLKHLLTYLRERNIVLKRLDWDDEVNSWRREWLNMINEALSRRYDGYVNPARFFKRLYEVLPENSIISGGQGVHIVYTYQFMKLRRPRRFLAATNLGAMSYAFPAAMGAKVAYPDYQVIAVVGDGEFMMSVHDFETCVREDIPVKVVVVNDFSYRVLLLRQRIQKSGRIYGTLLGNPSFESLAKAYGGDGSTLNTDSKIDEEIERMMESDKPYILDLRIDPSDLPPLNIEASLRMAG